MHISKDITGSRSRELAGKKIALCLTGSVAVLRIVELARDLMRLGAEVYPVMTRAACALVTPDLLEWATGHKAVTRLTGRVEHVELAGHVEGKADLVLVAPATANTISKIACCIDDTPVTTVVTTALGEEIPVMIIPAMHESMYNHPLLKENIAKLKSIGVNFIDSRVEEGKAKIAGNRIIIHRILAILASRRQLSGQRILITAGPTLEYIDPVRIITNKSSGKMGMALAEAALAMGAEVTLIYGPGSEIPPASAKVINVETSREMYQAVETELRAPGYHLVIAAAAVGDWTVDNRQEKKIPTQDKAELTLHLKPTVKIVDRVKNLSPASVLVCFRAVTGLTDEELLKNGIARMEKAKADFIVVNDVSRTGAGFDVDTNEVFVIKKNNEHIHVPRSSKKRVAETILQFVYGFGNSPCL